MQNDAKLALVIGVGLVVAVAVIYFQKDLLVSRRAANVVTTPAAPESNPTRRVTARPTSRQHTVEEGDSLYGLAERYYGDGDRFTELYRANKAVLKRPDRLEVGTVLVIPNVPEAPAAEEATEAP